MLPNNNKTDAATVLSAIAGSIREFSDAVDLHIALLNEHVALNPFQPGAGSASLQMKESIPARFWERLGIRHLVSDSLQNKPAIESDPENDQDKNDQAPSNWDAPKNTLLIEELKQVLSGCQLIQFASWAKMNNASDCWDELFSDVIKPLNKRTFEFIFQLGDATRHQVFEVDEILDIMSSYSTYGRVSLILSNKEADQLYTLLNGRAPFGSVFGNRTDSTREKYQFLFNTMNVHVLLIRYSNSVVLCTKDGQFDLAGKSLDHLPFPEYTSDAFNAGYQLGLLLRLDIAHAVALALAFSGASIEHGYIPGSKELIAFLNDWVTAFHPQSFTIGPTHAL